LATQPGIWRVARRRWSRSGLREHLAAKLAGSPRTERRRAIGLAVSGLLHAFILAALLFLHFRPRHEENWLPPPSYDVIYQNGGAKEAPAIRNPAPHIKNLPPSPPQASSAAPPSLPTPPVPPAPPVASAAPPTPAPVPAPAPPPVAKPAPSTPEQMETAIQLAPPVFQPPPLEMPKPPPSVVRPAPATRLRPAFPTPMNYSLGRPTRSQIRSAQPQRGVDLAFAPLASGSDRYQPQARSDNPAVGADWLSEVAAWWQRHAYYPPQAGMNGEQGDVTVQMIVQHDGRVTYVHLERRSGSQWLDMASVAVFRDADLPPLPPEVRDKDITLHFTIHYVIVD
jgi:periplasmic protein TonB